VWRERFKDYLIKEQESLRRQIRNLESRNCEMWETSEGERKDITEEYTAELRSHLAEIEQLLVEESLS
jgi:hypothetical protein